MLGGSGAPCLSRTFGRRIKMHYQLVLQFGGNTLSDYNEMVELEDLLIENLGKSAEVDGHDCGSGETNIFILTSDPARTFGKVRQTLCARENWIR